MTFVDEGSYGEHTQSEDQDGPALPSVGPARWAKKQGPSGLDSLCPGPAA